MPRIDASPSWSLLEHEIRGTVGAIAGLVRLLGDDRVSDEDRARVLASLRNATERAATLAGDVGQITRWSRHADAERRQSISLRDVLDRALQRARASETDPIDADVDAELDVTVPVVDADAVVSAFATLARAARRASNDVLVCRARTYSAGGVEVLLGPTSAGWLSAAERRPVDVSRSGLGLSVLLAATIVDAHDGQVLQDASGAVISVQLPLTATR